MAQLFLGNGLPPGVLNFLTGPGDVVGGRMVMHPRTRFVNFTGSREVGTQIYEQAAKHTARSEVAQTCDPRNGGQGRDDC